MVMERMWSRFVAAVPGAMPRIAILLCGYSMGRLSMEDVGWIGSTITVLMLAFILWNEDARLRAPSMEWRRGVPPSPPQNPKSGS